MEFSWLWAMTKVFFCGRVSRLVFQSNTHYHQLGCIRSQPHLFSLYETKHRHSFTHPSRAPTLLNLTTVLRNEHLYKLMADIHLPVETLYVLIFYINLILVGKFMLIKWRKGVPITVTIPKLFLQLLSFRCVHFAIIN